MKLKNTCFFDIFLCQNFLSCEFDSVFHGLGSSEYGCCCFLWPGYGIKLQYEPLGSSLRAMFTVWQHGTVRMFDKTLIYFKRGNYFVNKHEKSLIHQRKLLLAPFQLTGLNKKIKFQWSPINIYSHFLNWFLPPLVTITN